VTVWTEPITYEVGELIDETIANQQFRDNMDYLHRPHYVALTRTAGQSINDSTDTPIIWDVQTVITDTGMHSLVSNPTRVIIPEDGIYLAVGRINWAGSAVGDRAALITLNAGATVVAQTRIAAGAAGAKTIEVVMTKYLEENDYIELNAFQSSGGALSATLSNAAPEFYVVHLGDT
jgi:hypothetical protein